MVGLLKKDFRDSSRIFIPLLLVGIIFIAISSFHEYMIRKSMISGVHYLSGGAYDLFSVTLVATAVTLVILGIVSIYRYLYNNIYSDRGYELFTLPLETYKLILSKVLVTLMWIFVFGILYYLFETISTILSVSYPENAWFIDHFSYLFYEGSNGLVFRAYVNDFIKVLLFIMITLFAGALSNSKYVQSGRPIVALVIIVVTLVLYFTIDSSIMGLGIHPYYGGTESLADYFIRTFRYAMDSRIVNLLLLSRSTMLVILTFGTHYLWKNKLQF